MLRNFLINVYKNSPLLNSKKGFFSHVNNSFIQMSLSLRYYSNDENIFIVLPNLYEAQKYYDDLSNILGDEKVLFYPAEQMLTTLMALGSPEFKNERLFTLRKLIENKSKYIIVTTQEGLTQRQLKPTDYLNSVMTINLGDTFDKNELVKKLIYDGYQFNYTVERPGEFSTRGSILDIFTHDNKNPYRLDFFGDEIDSIKTFDVITQVSIEKANSIDISPLSELFFTDKQKQESVKRIYDYFKDKTLSKKEESKFEHDMDLLSQRKRMDTLIAYISFFNEDETTILDFSQKHSVVIVEPHKIELNEQTRLSDLETYNQTMGGSSLGNLPFRMNIDYIKRVTNLSFDIYQSLNKETTDLKINDIEGFNGELLPLKMTLKEYKNFTVLFTVKNLVNYEKLKMFLNDQEIEFNTNEIIENSINVVNEDMTGSFIDLENKLIVLSESTLYQIKNRNKIRYRSVINQSIKVRDTSELVAGDYVVHYDFGIGQYLGLKTMKLSQDARDYLHIIYEGNESLYVPTDQIDKVLKYKSNDAIPPKLNRLSSNKWSKTKASVRMKIKDLSDRLLKLYATRNEAIGYKFDTTNELLESFENDFAYDETIDQKKAIDSVKEDMGKTKPMDRLIAGDVGFGKTEVALRAAAIAVTNAKQVAYLVPTTVLARQHYYTFKERFEKYGGNVALISRFIGKKQQTEMLDKLAKGYIDIIVGTHRLLSEDVRFKDLGLFIIDEEQRFGVEHKEKIKEIKVNVDTLTLSATPIPRTLQMAMYGLKDLSMIDTPPLNRYPVQTYVVERQEALIKEAIDRELARGGQVFYLYNKVDDIELIVHKLNKLVPNAKIAFAHGKMNKNTLENVLQSFIEKDFDVLVSTTIIETGVDIPNTNTLIIHDADKLGLAQLYQLRGRVGRSDKIAYAYLMYDARKDINDEARKRLSVIEDFTDLGSGFKIALRDLSIRGAGDILGDEQSGFIDSVGMELYMKLLDEVMSGKEEDDKKTEENDQIFASRHIPSSYINHDPVRIEIHKRIADLNKLQDIDNLKNELIDRFGPLDPELMNYMYEKLYKKLGSKIGIEKTIKEAYAFKMVLSLEASHRINGEKLLETASLSKTPIKLSTTREHIEIEMNIKNFTEHWLFLACVFVENYLKSMEVI